MKKRTLDERCSGVAPRPSKRVCVIASSSLRDQTSPDENDKHDTPQEISPQDYLTSLIQSSGSTVKFSASLQVQGFFASPKEHEIKAYSHDVLDAVRTRDIEKLRHFHKNGRPLQCSNKFGESLLHLACRRGFDDVVEFLVQEAGVTVQVIDDYGRTPLHDAFWTCEPNLKLVERLIQMCPSLLFMKDARGNTPIEYARREHWVTFIQFLQDKQHLFLFNQDECISVVG